MEYSSVHTFDDPPGVQPSPHSLSTSFHHCVTANHSERGALLQKETRGKVVISTPLCSEKAV